MKKTCTYIIIVSLTILCLAVSAFADQTIRYRNAKSLGMGDAKVAGGFGHSGFVNNPALLSRVNVMRISIIPLNLTLNDNLVDIVEFVDDNQDNFRDFSKEEGEEGYMTVDEKAAFLRDIEEHDNQWSQIYLSPMVNIAFNIMDFGVGLAVFNTTDIGLKIDRGIYEPRVWGNGVSNTAVVLGVAKPFSMLYPGLTLGANFKVLNRRHSDIFQIPASDLGNASDTVDPIIEDISEQNRNTFAMDIGGLLELPVIDAEIGASIQSIGDGRGSSVDFGIAKRMLNNRLTILADYIDFFDNNKENVFNKIHFGAEYKYLFLALRAGINSGYPSLGLGLNFKIIDIDTAYYSEELTSGPGGDDDTRFVTQIKVGW